jgi:3-hydroxyisobutyrate dehydrogenase-like beta-hydroxyacid dehydrogenase
MHIGFVGLGNMGRPMACRLLSAGHGLTVFDLDSRKAAEVAQAGAHVTDSASHLGGLTDIIFASLPSCEASRSVAREVLRGGRVKIYVETSTIGRETIRRIVEMAPLDVTIIDAPISGGTRAAQDGTLAIMVAGSHPAVIALQPLFAALANKVFHVGEEPGLAQVCKLANNAISFTALVATCEAVVMAVKAGVNASTLIDVINSSTGRNAATLDRFPNAILPRTFNGGAPLGGALKDLELYLNEAHHGDVVTDVVQRVFETWRCSQQEIGPDADFTNIVRYFEQRAGVEVKGVGPIQTKKI